MSDKEDLEDIRKRLGGMRESKLSGDDGLVAAIMRELYAYKGLLNRMYIARNITLDEKSMGKCFEDLDIWFRDDN